MLSYALQQTWRNREGRRLTVAGYRATGGIDGAVAQAADNVYNGLDPARQDTLQRVLLRLVTFGEGTPDSRRRVTLAELTGPEDSEQAIATRAVLADLIDARLITADEDTVEITHETLLTAWPRLRQWLTEDRAGLRIHRDLTDAARDWQREGRDHSRLFRGARLIAARNWAAYHDKDLNADERAFLIASQHDELRTTRRRRIALVALAALTVLSGTAAGIAIQQRGDALTARDQAIANQVVVEASQLTASDPSLAAQLDVAANRIGPTPDSEAQLVGTTTAPLSSILTGLTDGSGSVTFSPKGRILAVSNGDAVWLWNLTDPSHPTRLGQSLTGPTSGVLSMAFSPDGRTLAVASGESTVWLWNLADPARPTRLGRPLPGDATYSVAFSPDGRTLALGGTDAVWLWNLANPSHPARLGQPLPSGDGQVAFSPNGRILAVGSQGTVWLWNLADNTRPARLAQLVPSSTGVVTSIAFSRDGRTLAFGSGDNRVWLWNLTDPARPTRHGQPLTGPASYVTSVAFSPDGRTLAIGSDDHSVWLWNLAQPARPTQLGQPLTGNTTGVTSVAFSPDGRTLAVAGHSDQTIRLWNLPSSVLTGPTSSVASVAFSRDGRTLAAGGDDHNVWLWNPTDPSNPTKLGQPLTGPGGITSAAFSPDRRLLAVGSSDRPVWLWNLTDPARPTPTRLGEPPTGPDFTAFTSVAFSADGRTLAAADPGTVWLWNLTDPARPTRLGPALTFDTPSAVISVAFSPDGRTLAVGDATVWLWNLADPSRPTQLAHLVPGFTGYVSSVAFSPDGRTLAAGSDDHKVWLWNLSR